jgi:putative phosphoesterase
MRLAIISDTHMPKGGRRLPDACVERLRDADLILHAGDVTTTQVLDTLEAIGPPVAAVHGNCDEYALVERLPEQRIVEAGGARIAMVHDGGRSEGRLQRLRAAHPDVDAVVFGHSHLPLHERAPGDGFQIFNPGSPTERRRAPAHTMGLATVADDSTLSFELVTLD